MSVKAMVLAHILSWEGELSTDPHDPGGVTKFGISSASYPQFNIIELPREKALEIYEKDFWLGLNLPELPPPVALVVMDAAVNMGPYTAVRLLQEAAGELREDGVLGPKTKERVQKLNPQVLAREITELRLVEYAKYEQFDRYGHGWVKRSMDTLMKAMNMGS